MDVADALPDDPSTLKAMLPAERARAERLEQMNTKYELIALRAKPMRQP
jgi:hypothetical protein